MTTAIMTMKRSLAPATMTMLIHMKMMKNKVRSSVLNKHPLSLATILGQHRLGMGSEKGNPSPEGPAAVTTPRMAVIHERIAGRSFGVSLDAIGPHGLEAYPSSPGLRGCASYPISGFWVPSDG